MLVAAVVGSGIMAEHLAGGNVALALLGNTLATGAMLVVLIVIFAEVSGAHFNPAVSLVACLRQDFTFRRLGAYVIAQIGGGLLGTLAAHVMFGGALLQVSTTVRSGPEQWLSEGVATFGLVVTVLGTLRSNAPAVAWTVGLYIAAAYWFTASTSFANPAVTIARAFTHTFSGIAPASVPFFVGSQFAGALAAERLSRWLFVSDAAANPAGLSAAVQSGSTP